MLHVKVKREDLAKAAAQANSIATSKHSMRICAFLLLEAEGDVLSVTASDLEITYRMTLPADVIEAGRATVPAKIFTDLTRNVNYEEVTLRETENQSIILTCGAFSTKLFGLSPESFPEMPDFDDTSLATVDGRFLADGINKTIASIMSGDETYNLSGVQFIKEIEEEIPVLKLASTDTQRMTLASLMVDDLEKLPLEAGIIVPPKGLTELKKLSDDATVVELGVSKTHLVAITQLAKVSIRLLEGPFPDYRKVIPVDNNLKAWFNRAELLDTLKRIKVFITGRHSIAKFSFGSDHLDIHIKNPELGEAEETVKIEYSGPEIVTGFNPEFYTDILATMASERVQLALSEGSVSYLFTGAEDPGFLAVVVSSELNDLTEANEPGNFSESGEDGEDGDL